MKDKATIDTVISRPEIATLPTLLKFQNGQLSAISKENTTYCQIENKTTHTKEAMVASSGHIYRGAITSSDANNLTENYLLVRNKTTNKVRIIPIEQACLTNNIYEKMEDQRQQPQFAAMSKEYAVKTLLKQFGGRKASRYVHNREQMKMSVDIVRQELDSTVQETSLVEDELDTTVKNAEYLQSISPPCNREAKNIEEVYNVEDVVPAALLERLDEEAKVVYSTSQENLPIKSEYLLDCIKQIQSKKTSSSKDILNMKLIIYMDGLQSLMALRTRNLKTAELSGITEKVENDIRQRFSDPNIPKSFTRTTYSTEKALTHFIVLSLLISEKYEVDVNVLSRTLNTNIKKIKTYAHVVNALPKSRSDIVSLRLPSNVPPLPSGNRFGRKK